MSERSSSTGAALRGSEGELLTVQVTLEEPRRLETLLDILVALPFPVNPEIIHSDADGPTVTVEFPAYANFLPAISRALTGAGFSAEALSTRAALAS
jgi:hypothetical protein